MGMIRRRAVPAPAPVPVPVAEGGAAPATAPATAAAGGETGPEEVAATGEETETGAVRPLPELIAAARDRYANLLAAGRLPSVRQLRREMRVGHPKAVALRAALVQAAALRAA